MGLPREVLRWLLSLQLSLPVRNPRRYLVAEILTKYNIGELSLHSFTNTSSTEQNRCNWSLIQKCLRTQGVNLTNETIDAILLQDQSAVERFLQNLFSFVTSQADRGDGSAPPTPQPSAAARLESDRNASGLSEQARLDAVNSQYTMDNLQHLMQQQLALLAPERQQGIIASVIEQRSIFVQKLMDGGTPQDAMSAALANARVQLPDEDTAQLATQLGQQMIAQHAADNRQPAHVMAPAAAAEPHPHVWQQQVAAVPGERVANSRQPRGFGGATQQHAAAPFSVREEHEMSQSPTHRLRSMRNNGTETSPRHTMNAWRNDVNNPKTESYRYWDLGSLGPEANEELMAKKIAAQKAREYGIRVGELVKSNCRPREPPKKEMSKQERATQYAKTVPIPTKRAGTKAITQTSAKSLDAEESTLVPVAALQRRDSVSILMTRHDANAKSIVDIKAEVRTWEQEDQGPALPQQRRKSPARAQKPAAQPVPTPHVEHAKHDTQPVAPAQPPPQAEQEVAPVAEQEEAAGDTSVEVDTPMPRESALEAV